MRSAPSITRLLGLVLAAVLAVAGLVAASAPTAQAADPLAGAPAVGTCHDVGIKQAMKDSLAAAPVACSADHTLLTTGVVQVTTEGDLAGPKIYREASAACREYDERWIGSNVLRRALTLYHGFVFIPNSAQQQAGARWVSCHLAVWDTKGLNDLPETLPKLSKKPAVSVARCGTRTTYVTCAERHTYRATVAAFVKAKGKDRAVIKTMRDRGPKVCSRRAGGAGRFTYWRYTPTKVVLVCLKKTRR
ncbi:MAG TPA: hypothetical protein VMF51_12170 [Nocardioides sp.]|uniref:hypothetical protein n=1 Tax=Nocardioides sp. TaxID=35761 RepID=UPI002BD72544|nr:hypothetical protein [Nocardioides sp.]HTW15882.1 hypothetical protein [Nocardioides sp.]